MVGRCEGCGADSYYNFDLQLFLCVGRPVLAARAGGDLLGRGAAAAAAFFVGGLRAGRDCGAGGTAAGALLRGYIGGTSAASAAYIAAYVGASCGGGGLGAQSVSSRWVIFSVPGGYFMLR